MNKKSIAIPPLDVLSHLATFLTAKELFPLMRICHQFCRDIKKILELPMFSAYKVEYVLGRLASKRVWKIREWLDIYALGNAYDHAHVKPFYDTGYHMLEFVREHETVFCIETQSKYRPMIWNKRVHGDPDKYLLRFHGIPIYLLRGEWLFWSL
jgi:hypothetical protein